MMRKTIIIIGILSLLILLGLLLFKDDYVDTAEESWSTCYIKKYDLDTSIIFNPSKEVSLFDKVNIGIHFKDFKKMKVSKEYTRTWYLPDSSLYLLCSGDINLVSSKLSEDSIKYRVNKELQFADSILVGIRYNLGNYSQFSLGSSIDGFNYPVGEFSRKLVEGYIMKSNLSEGLAGGEKGYYTLEVSLYPEKVNSPTGTGYD